MSKIIEVRVPDVGDFDRITIIEVLVAVGEEVEAEQSLITLESDKATMEVPAPVAGTIKSLLVKLNDQVSEGALIAILEVAENAPEAAGYPAEDQQGAKPNEQESNQTAVSASSESTS